jgi:micrococcal nuclease
MRPRVLLFSLFLFLVPSLLNAGSWEGKVVSVSDGDTIKVLKDGKQVKMRLAAIDCPEKKQPYGQKAKQFTSDMVADKVVTVWETDTDRCDRIVGFVFIGEKNLNKEILSSGLVWHYKKYS